MLENFKPEIKILLIVAFVAAILAVGGILLWPQLKIDKCLDRGGVWDYENSRCITVQSTVENRESCDLDGDKDCDQADHKVFIQAIHGCEDRGPIAYNELVDVDHDGCVTPNDERTLFPWIVQERETVNWQTYRNDEFGFEVKYPEDWQIEFFENENFFVLTNIKIAKQYVDASKRIATEGFAFNNGLFVHIYESDKTLEDFIQSYYNYPDSPHGNTIKSTKNIELPNGMQAIFVQSNTGGYGLDSATLLKSKNYVFRFIKYYGGAFGLEEYTDQQFDQILSTFRFVEDDIDK